MLRFALISSVVLFIFILIGCSAGTSINPVFTNPADNIPLAAGDITPSEYNHQFGGTWDINFDWESMRAQILPNRELSAHFNITLLLPPPSIGILSFDPVSGIVEANVTITNPNPISGYDVRLIIFTDNAGHMLKNPDNWTALYDIAGGLPINPFKAYAKEESGRVFSGVNSHTEKLFIYLPSGNPNVSFAMDASFPTNCLEPYEIKDYSQGLLLEGTGGSTAVEVKVHDWQNDVNWVMLYCPSVLGGSYIPLNKLDSERWGATITNTMGASKGSYDLFVIASSTNSGNIYMYDVVKLVISKQDLTYSWVKTWGGTLPEGAESIVTDSSGNIYIVGYFNGTSDFDPGTGVYNLVTLGGQDAFAMKLDPGGNFIWAKSWGSSNTWGEGCTDIACDGGTGLYITGYFSGTTDFDPGSGSDTRTAVGKQDNFLMKLDLNGNYQWVRAFGGSEMDYISDISISAANIYICGYFESTADFDPSGGTQNITSAGGIDSFFCKYDTSGNYLWVKVVGGTSSDLANNICTDSTGNIFLAGYYSDTVDMDPGTGVDLRASNGVNDCFISRFDSAGNFLWANTFGGYYSDYVNAFIVSTSGELYLGGNFRDTVDFDPGPGEYYLASCSANPDAYLSKFDSDGDFVWAKVWGGVDMNDVVTGIEIGVDSNIYVTGLFRSTADFDPGTGVFNITSKGVDDIYLSRFTSSGDFVKAYAWGGTAADYAYCIYRHESSLFVCGCFQNNVDFNPDSPVDNRVAIGGTDSYLSRFEY
jgi:hypothetical protein